MTIDPTDYTRIPPAEAAAVVATSRKLLALVPSGRLSQALASIRRKLRTATDELASALEDVAVADASPRIDRREADARVDAAWRAVHLRIRAWIELPAGTAGREEAERFLALIFPTGLAFLAEAYEVEWAESETRIALINREQAAFEALVGAPFLANLVAAQDAYGKALQVTVAGAPTKTADLAGPLDVARKVLRKYALVVLAELDIDDASEASEADRLLSPILELREQNRRRADRAKGEEAPAVEPTPPEA
jgi:hypothetical protein